MSDTTGRQTRAEKCYMKIGRCLLWLLSFGKCQLHSFSLYLLATAIVVHYDHMSFNIRFVIISWIHDMLPLLSYGGCTRVIIRRASSPLMSQFSPIFIPNQRWRSLWCAWQRALANIGGGAFTTQLLSLYTWYSKSQNMKEIGCVYVCLLYKAKGNKL